MLFRLLNAQCYLYRTYKPHSLLIISITFIIFFKIQFYLFPLINWFSLSPIYPQQNYCKVYSANHCKPLNHFDWQAVKGKQKNRWIPKRKCNYRKFNDFMRSSVAGMKDIGLVSGRRTGKSFHFYSRIASEVLKWVLRSHFQILFIKLSSYFSESSIDFHGVLTYFVGIK